jgi:hypothetical protein
MMRRPRERSAGRTVPLATYLRLRRFAIPIALGGVAAAAWLWFRLLPTMSDAPWDASPFAADVPVAILGLLVWAIAAVAVLLPPAEVIARSSRTLAPYPLIIWPLGQRIRPWALLAVPIAGLLSVLGVMFSVEFAAGIAPLLDGSVPWWSTAFWQTVAAATIPVLSAGAVIACSRMSIYGAELTATGLITHGQLRSRRVSRSSIAEVDVVDVHPVLVVLLAIGRMDVDHAVRLTLTDGTRRSILVPEAGWGDAETMAELLRAWADAPAQPEGVPGREGDVRPDVLSSR